MTNGIQIRPPLGLDVVGSIQQGLALREQRQGAPARQEQRGLQLQGQRDTSRLNSIVQGAQQLKGITSAEGKINFLMQRRQQLQTAGIGTQDTDEALQLAQQGNFEELERVTDNAIALGRRQTGQTPRQIEFAQFESMPTGTESEKLAKQQFGQAIGAVSRRATVAERVEAQQRIGDIKSEQDIVTTKGKEKVKLEEQVKSIPVKERTLFLSKNRDVFAGDISASVDVLDDIDRAIEIWETAPGTISGPIAGRAPALTSEGQELESILAKLGVDRLSAFKGATSEQEMAVAFRGGASIEQDAKAGLARLGKQREAVVRNTDRLRGLLNQSKALINKEPAQPQSTAAPLGDVTQLSDEELFNF